MSRTSLILLVIAIVSVAAVYLCDVKSGQSEIQREEQEKREVGFTVYPGDGPQWNWWDAGAVAFVIIGGSSGLAAIWKRKG